jgi:hypothetical protein
VGRSPCWSSPPTGRRSAEPDTDAGVRGLEAGGVDHVVVVGDLNDTPESEPLAPLITGTDVRDISTHPAFEDGGRPGTYASPTST